MKNYFFERGRDFLQKTEKIMLLKISNFFRPFSGIIPGKGRNIESGKFVRKKIFLVSKSAL